MSVLLESIGRGICRITLNRPSKANAINLALSKSLQETLERFEDDDELKVAIISGAGGNFCAGYDLSEVIDRSTGMPDIRNIEQLLWPVQGTRLSAKKVTIAAIEGHAAGFGFELALKCDFRVAERAARLGFLNRRFGVPIMSGGTVMLPKLVGFPCAVDMIATGKAQLAPEALQKGTISVIADIGCSVGRAFNLARCLEKFPQGALSHDLNKLRNRDLAREVELHKHERHEALEYLSQLSGPLELAAKFLEGEIGRHGNTDLGNLVKAEPEVTL